MSKKTSSTLIGLLVFVPLALTTGYLGAIVVDMVGLTGYLVTITTTSLLFLVYAWIAKIRIEPSIYVVFFVLALGSTVLSQWVTNLLVITDNLIQSVIYSLMLGTVLVVLSLTPKQQQKPPQVPKI